MLFTQKLAAEDLVWLSDRSNRVAERCYRQAGYFGWEQTKCAHAEQARQGELVKRAYAAALVRGGRQHRRELSASQDIWIGTVDRKCKTDVLFGPTEIGTIATVEGLMCLATERRNRVVWLEQQHHIFRNDD